MEKVIIILINDIELKDRGIEARVNPLLEKGYSVIRTEFVDSSYVVFLKKY